MKWNNEARKFDFNLTFIVLALTVIGLINLYSATHSQQDSSLNSQFNSQVMWLGLGWVVYIATSLFNYNFFRRIAWGLYSINLVLLIGVGIFGRKIKGAQSWVDLGFFRYQPSETMKVAIVLVLAAILAKYAGRKQLGLKEILLPFIVFVIPFAFTAMQPDLGTAMVMAAVATTMILFLGVKTKILLSVIPIMCIASPLVWSFGLKTHQKKRVISFVNPGKDLRGGGYNSQQSKIAVGSGLIFGKGFRKGTQSQLEFLPERHTDFIFSVLSEEHGFIGSSLTLILFFLLFLSILKIAQSTEDPFGGILAVGIGSILFWHFFVNIGMVIGILPVIGVPLPLLSYGGSSLVTTMGALGLVSSVSLRRYLF